MRQRTSHQIFRLFTGLVLSVGLYHLSSCEATSEVAALRKGTSSSGERRDHVHVITNSRELLLMPFVMEFHGEMLLRSQLGQDCTLFEGEDNPAFIAQSLLRYMLDRYPSGFLTWRLLSEPDQKDTLNQFWLIIRGIRKSGLLPEDLFNTLDTANLEDNLEYFPEASIFINDWTTTEKKEQAPAKSVSFIQWQKESVAFPEKISGNIIPELQKLSTATTAPAQNRGGSHGLLRSVSSTILCTSQLASVHDIISSTRDRQRNGKRPQTDQGRSSLCFTKAMELSLLRVKDGVLRQDRRQFIIPAGSEKMEDRSREALIEKMLSTVLASGLYVTRPAVANSKHIVVTVMEELATKNVLLIIITPKETMEAQQTARERATDWGKMSYEEKTASAEESKEPKEWAYRINAIQFSREKTEAISFSEGVYFFSAELRKENTEPLRKRLKSDVNSDMTKSLETQKFNIWHKELEAAYTDSIRPPTTATMLESLISALSKHMLHIGRPKDGVMHPEQTWSVKYYQLQASDPDSLE